MSSAQAAGPTWWQALLAIALETCTSQVPSLSSLPISPSRSLVLAGTYLLGQRVIMGTFSWEGGL